MKISEIGGEFELIKKITKDIKDKKIIKGIGDDCAVIDNGEKYLLVTTDMMVENDHFSCRWQTPKQIGMKLVEVNVSDIVAMGGKPTYAFISMSLKKDTSVEFIDELYKGVYESAEKHGIIILGGDTTHGTELVFNLALLGDVEKDSVRFRSGAKKGEQICVTGNLGASTAGLRLLLKGKEGYTKEHLEPKSRTVDEGIKIARYASTMIDVSDGLASEVKHICEESCMGAIIYHEMIPIIKKVKEAAKSLEEDAYDYALYGGEDFQIVFTLPKEDVDRLKKEFSDFTIVGEIVDSNDGIHLLKDGKKEDVKKGFDHFF